MLKIAVVGIGRMGSHHVDMYQKLIKDGADISLVALCDVEKSRLDGTNTHVFNMGTERERDFSSINKYMSIDEMLANESLDIVDVVAPTYLHCELSCKALAAGCHVMCEKPMALNGEQCDMMLETAKKHGRLLMIGQCLHFWREYVYLQQVITQKAFGDVKGGFFWRGGYADHENNPSWHDWIITADKGGGGLFDQHIHDTDFIRLCFGEPERVVTAARKYFKNSADDIVSTNYIYSDKVINAVDDIAYAGYPFSFGYRVDMQNATVEFDKGVVTVYPHRKEPYHPDVTRYGTADDAYYNEIEYFISCVKNGSYPERCRPEDAKASVLLALKEAESARLNRA